MRKPRVGVTTSRRGGSWMWWFNHLALRRAGAEPVRITALEPIQIERLDAIVVGGGDDIEATLYGGKPQPAVRVDPQRDRLELQILDEAARRGLPVLGICRGAQMINVHRGGSLHTDIWEVFVAAPKMRTVLPKKTVRIAPDSRLHLLLETDATRVNALHHQSVDRLGRGLRAVAHDEHGIVQAVEATDGPFLLGVQWHPEFLVLDARQQGLFRALVAAAGAEPVRKAA